MAVSTGKINRKRDNQWGSDMNEIVTYHPVGHIHTPFKDIEGMPIQPTGARGVAGTVVINETCREGLKDLEGFSHIFLIYQLHLCRGYALQVKPFLDNAMHGIFACRSPKRPNQIGLSLVKLISVEGAVLHIEDVDMVDGNLGNIRRSISRNLCGSPPEGQVIYGFVMHCPT